MRPELELPTTVAWYLTWTASEEHRTVAEVVSRMVEVAVKDKLRHLTPTRRWMLDHSMPGWMKYEGEPWSKEDGPKTANGQTRGA